MFLILGGCFVGAAIFFAATYLIASVRWVPLNKIVITQRYGAVHRTLKPGYHFLWPFENVVSVAWEWDEESASHRRQRTGIHGCLLPTAKFQIDAMPCTVRTSDNAEMKVNSVLTIRITNVEVFHASFNANPIEYILKQIELEITTVCHHQTAKTIFSDYNVVRKPCQDRLETLASSMAFVIEAFDIQSIEHSKDTMDLETKQAGERRARELALEVATAEHKLQTEREILRQTEAVRKMENEQRLALAALENAQALEESKRREEERQATHRRALEALDSEQMTLLRKQEIMSWGGPEAYLRKLELEERTRTMEMFANSKITTLTPDGLRYIFTPSKTVREIEQ